MTSINSKCYTDDKWIEDICEDLLVKNVPESSRRRGVAVCEVPKYWRSSKPEAFTPQFVGLGLYHRELPVTNELKLAAANLIFNNSHNLNKGDRSIQQHLKEFVRDSFYHADVSSKYSDEDLLDMLTSDCLFLLSFLGRSENFEEYFYTLTGRHDVVNPDGVELTMDAIKREVFMLENQLPLRFLRAVFPEEFDKTNSSFVLSDARGVCPLVYYEGCPKLREDDDHLLGFLYRITVPEPHPKPRVEELWNDLCKHYQRHIWIEYFHDFVLGRNEPLHRRLIHHLLSFMGISRTKTKSDPRFEFLDGTLDARNWYSRIIRFVFWCVVGPLLIFFLAVSFIVLLILKPFLWVFGNLFYTVRRELIPLLPLPSLSIIINPVLKMFQGLGAQVTEKKTYATIVERMEQMNNVFSQESNAKAFGDLVGKCSKRYLVGKYPKTLAEHIKRTYEEFQFDSAARLPSTEIHNAGIRFQNTEYGISSIKFDEVESQFYLPMIQFDVNSEVIINNLLAYEAMIKSQSLVFTRYIKLMRALIDTAEDVRLLVRQKIIHTQLSDEVVVKLLKGMKIVNKPTNTPELDVELSRVYIKLLTTKKLKRVATKYAISSGKIFTVVAALAVLVLTTVQMYCSVVGCSAASKIREL